jgi:hypothetical protein
VARKRPTASDVPPPALTLLAGGKPDLEAAALTRAEARAQQLSAPLTHAQLTEHFKATVKPPLRVV